MKYHRVLVEAVVGAITDIFETGRKADRVIEFVLKSDKRWGARDRAFVAENVYEMVRWWRLLEFVTPDPHGYWARFAAWQILKGHTLPDWPEFKDTNPDRIKKRQAEAQKIRKIKESIPDWLDAVGEAELGQNWNTELSALNQTAPVVLRTNTLKINVLELQAQLQTVDILSHLLPQIPDALVLTEKKNVFQTTFFKEGFFEVQDAGSQAIAPFLGVQPGMRVIDACAGAGGKTLHLAALMQNKGQLIAMDIEDWKLQELRRRTRRNGVGNVETRLIEAKTIKRLRATADRVLLDVPCTGLGVLRRNPDTKWKLQPAFLEQIKQTQYEILENYSQMVKPSGKLVYATCSILPSESEWQVQRFLQQQGSKWQLLAEQRTSPAQDGFDGFYMACLQKNTD
ncbi:MAG: methyltransferase domain-containing protein [Runella slithyformis]|nr:MAG: methyltransferase domain-containing protein [Runella slithyformis]TAE98549.1 MAG: methyltransferase domain-containing protein [Runella slithyformis]TAF28858.1 MAG: methyltransferase domain-containing protein [Runella slithyformis]TAF48975.1 MAG: methyltransferase domain-containing protein [Runella slithyformis]TAF83536.1 MAG: methyltransferase domain-containing protein [Runella slithyformis]